MRPKKIDETQQINLTCSVCKSPTPLFLHEPWTSMESIIEAFYTFFTLFAFQIIILLFIKNDEILTLFFKTVAGLLQPYLSFFIFYFLYQLTLLLLTRKKKLYY